MSLGEIKFIFGVIIRLQLEKQAKSYGFIARVHLAWFSGDFEAPTWVLPVPVVCFSMTGQCQSDTVIPSGHPNLPLVFTEMV
jgi:hypothetical protein